VRRCIRAHSSGVPPLPPLTLHMTLPRRPNLHRPSSRPPRSPARATRVATVSQTVRRTASTGRLIRSAAARMAARDPSDPSKQNSTGSSWLPPVMTCAPFLCEVSEASKVPASVTSLTRARPRSLLLVVAFWRAQRSARPTGRALLSHRWYRSSARPARTGGFLRPRGSAR
jgi:hypothetical protein